MVGTSLGLRIITKYLATTITWSGLGSLEYGNAVVFGQSVCLRGQGAKNELNALIFFVKVSLNYPHCRRLPRSSPIPLLFLKPLYPLEFVVLASLNSVAVAHLGEKVGRRKVDGEHVHTTGYAYTSVLVCVWVLTALHPAVVFHVIMFGFQSMLPCSAPRTGLLVAGDREKVSILMLLVKGVCGLSSALYPKTELGYTWTCTDVLGWLEDVDLGPLRVGSTKHDITRTYVWLSQHQDVAGVRQGPKNLFFHPMAVLFHLGQFFGY